MKNFEFEHEGKKLWYSRSLACSVIILRYSDDCKNIEVLVTKRGVGVEYNRGKWNVPGGFIDFDENAKECAIRETWEETGVKLPPERVYFEYLDTDPHGARQTMAAIHYAIFAINETKDWKFSTAHSEPDEVEEIKWININDLDKYEWMNGQISNIKRVIEYFSYL